MLVVDRYHGIKAVASGRALLLDPKTWKTYTIEEYRDWPPFQVIVYPHRKAINEAKLSLGPGGVLRRDDYECQYDGCERRGVTIDHVVPRCQGGMSNWHNLVACCLQCNQRKAGRTPEEAGMRLKRSIRSPKWMLYEKFHKLCEGWDKRGE
jgi:hypothetical protein